MRTLSRASMALWSAVNRRATPFRHKTILESPTLAVYNVRLEVVETAGRSLLGGDETKNCGDVGENDEYRRLLGAVDAARKEEGVGGGMFDMLGWDGGAVPGVYSVLM